MLAQEVEPLLPAGPLAASWPSCRLVIVVDEILTWYDSAFPIVPSSPVLVQATTIVVLPVVTVTSVMGSGGVWSAAAIAGKRRQIRGRIRARRMVNLRA